MTVSAGAGRLYGPGQPSAGAEVGVRFGASGMAIDGYAHGATLRWSDLQARAGEYAAATLTVEWGRDGANWALVIHDAATRKAIAPHLASLPRVAGANRGTRRLSTALILLFVVVPLAAVVLLVTQAGRIVDWAVDRIPIDTEIALGAEAAKQQRAALDIVDDHPALPAIRALGERLTRGSRYPFEFHVARDPSVNAFAMPGGFVVLNTGLLAQAERMEEVAGVLAHEVQHVERRHGLRGLVHAAGLSMALRLTLGDIGGSIAGAWAEGLARLRFSRDQERDADGAGVAALLRANIDPLGMVTFFRKLAAEGRSVPALLSSHPASEERLRAVEALVPKDRSFPPLPVEWSRLKGDPG